MSTKSKTTDITRQIKVGILPHQRVPKGDWTVWILHGGRGVGKSFRLTSWIVNQALASKTECIAVGRTWSEARSVLAEGPSGIRAYFERLNLDELLHGGSWATAYNRGSGTMAVKLANGSVIHFGSADKPDALRGGNYSAAIADELAFWPEEAWTNLRLTVRLQKADGTPPRIVAASTPNGMNWFYRTLIEPAPIPGVVFIGGGDTPPDIPPNTLDSNPHLADSAVENFRQVFAGTYLGDQELNGSFLDVSQSIYHPAVERHTEANESIVWPTPGNAEEVVAGLDLGAENPSAFITLARVGERWHVVAEAYGPAATPDSLHEMISHDLEVWNPSRIISDSNFPQTTNHLKAKGLPIIHADKRPGSVVDGIRAIQQLLHNDNLIVDTTAAPHLWNEMRGYRWATDKNGNSLNPERPVKQNDHALDAIRYALHHQTGNPVRDLVFS